MQINNALTVIDADKMFEAFSKYYHANMGSKTAQKNMIVFEQLRDKFLNNDYISHDQEINELRVQLKNLYNFTEKHSVERFLLLDGMSKRWKNNRSKCECE